jgi:hypothetical protein
LDELEQVQVLFGQMLLPDPQDIVLPESQSKDSHDAAAGDILDPIADAPESQKKVQVQTHKQKKLMIKNHNEEVE